MSSSYKYLFGPVPSRRLGRSLGVDLTPSKTCSFDCIFCQLGRTTNSTRVRSEYVPMGAVLAEIDDWLKRDGQADFVTMAGSGEPTLHTRFGDVIDRVHAASGIPVAVLTNGTMLGDADVRAQAAKADLVKVSLSAWDQASLEHVNRPCAGVVFNNLLDGIQRFRAQFRGKMWMEVFLIWGTNALPTEVARIAALIKAIGPDRVQLNTAVRPPAEEYAYALPREQLEELAKLFDPAAEVIAEFSAERSTAIQATEETVLAMLRRRPCTTRQIAAVFGLHANEVSKYVGKLLRTHRIRAERRNDDVYYTAADGGSAAKE